MIYCRTNPVRLTVHYHLENKEAVA